MRSDNLKYRRLTSTGDYSFGSGGNNYASGNEAVAQAIKTKLLLFYGEWWENLGEGIPMFQSVLGQTNPETIKSSLSMLVEQRIMEIEEVDSSGSGDALLGTFLAGMLKGYTPVRNLADAIAAGSDTAQSKWLTDFRTTPALQKQVIARRITFEEAE